MKLHRPFNEIVHFLGSRTYVQGTSLMEYILHQAAIANNVSDVQQIQVRRYKQISEVNSVICIKEESELADIDDVRATATLTIQGSNLSYAVVTLDGKLTRVPDMTYLQSPFDVNKNGNEATSIIGPQSTGFIQLLHELVQLNKMFHLSKYTNDKAKYKFVVGGFEKLTPNSFNGTQKISLKATILKEMNVGGMLLNMTKLTANQGDNTLSFLCPFVGKPEG